MTSATARLAQAVLILGAIAVGFSGGGPTAPRSASDGEALPATTAAICSDGICILACGNIGQACCSMGRACRDDDAGCLGGECRPRTAHAEPDGPRPITAERGPIGRAGL